MSLTLQSFSVREVIACPLPYGNYQKESLGFEVWLGDIFIGYAASYREALSLAHEYIKRSKTLWFVPRDDGTYEIVEYVPRDDGTCDKKLPYLEVWLGGKPSDQLPGPGGS